MGVKVYTIIQEATGKIVAISESKEDTIDYMLAKNFNENEYFYIKITKEKHANPILIDFDDLYLEHDKELDMVLTRVELQMIYDILGEEKGRIKSTLFDLEHYIKNYSFGKKEKKILMKAHAILDSTKKKKRLMKVIDLDGFIGFIYKSKNIADVFRDKLDDLKEKMYVFINLKE
jgi:hypothetical protein